MSDKIIKLVSENKNNPSTEMMTAISQAQNNLNPLNIYYYISRIMYNLYSYFE